MSQVAKGQFVQFPMHLIYDCPQLTRDDKWVLLTIMGECWSEKAQRLSYREIVSLSGVSLSLLASYANKKTGGQHEGIIDHIIRVTGYITVTQDKEINPTTGKPRGQTQTYIAVNYDRLWQDNLAYFEKKKQGVSHTNTSVSHTNTSVLPANDSVPYTNGSVSPANDSVSVARSEMTPYITIDHIDHIDYLDHSDHLEESVSSANAETHENVSSSHPSYSQSPEQPLQENEKKGSSGQEEMAMGKGQEKPARRKRTAKKQTEYDEVTRKRIDAVYEAMDKFYRKASSNEKAHITRDAQGDAAIYQLLDHDPTEKKLLRVMLDLWNEKDSRTGQCWWQKHMKAHLVCREYPTRLLALESDGKPLNMQAETSDEIDKATPTQPKTLGGYKFFTLSAGGK